eukprot:scaffold8622_cov46-Phaeocystis_antarctica.AAC.2
MWCRAGARWEVLARVRFAMRCAVCGVRCAVCGVRCAVCGVQDAVSRMLGAGGAKGWGRWMRGVVRYDLLLQRTRDRLPPGRLPPGRLPPGRRQGHPSVNPSKFTQHPCTMAASLRKRRGVGVGLLFLRDRE